MASGTTETLTTRASGGTLGPSARQAAKMAQTGCKAAAYSETRAGSNLATTAKTCSTIHRNHFSLTQKIHLGLGPQCRIRTRAIPASEGQARTSRTPSSQTGSPVDTKERSGPGSKVAGSRTELGAKVS